MPQSVPEIENATPVVQVEWSAMLIEVRYIDHATSKAFFTVFPDMTTSRIFDGAETFGEDELLFVADGLIGKHQHRKASHTVVNGGYVGIRHGLRQIDTVGTGDEICRYRLNGNTHVGSLSSYVEIQYILAQTARQ